MDDIISLRKKLSYDINNNDFSLKLTMATETMLRTVRYAACPENHVLTSELSFAGIFQAPYWG
jgi:hypothetical protein